MLFQENFISEVPEIILAGGLRFRMLGALYRVLLSQLIDWLFRRLLDWSIAACLLDYSIDWLTDWLIEWLKFLNLISCPLLGIDLEELIRFTRPFLNVISKAKAGTLVRALVDSYLNMNVNTGAEVNIRLEFSSQFWLRSGLLPGECTYF